MTGPPSVSGGSAARPFFTAARRRSGGGAPRHSPFVPVFAPLCLTLSLASRLVPIPVASAVAWPLQRALGEFFWCGFGAIVRSGARASGYEVRGVLLRIVLRWWREEVFSTSCWKRSPPSTFFLAVPEFRRLVVWRRGFVISVGVFMCSRCPCLGGVSERVPGFRVAQVWLAVYLSRLGG